MPAKTSPFEVSRTAAAASIPGVFRGVRIRIGVFGIVPNASGRFGRAAEADVFYFFPRTIRLRKVGQAFPGLRRGGRIGRDSFRLGREQMQRRSKLFSAAVMAAMGSVSSAVFASADRTMTVDVCVVGAGAGGISAGMAAVDA